MVMNKKEFLSALKSKKDLSEEEGVIVNDILESHFIIGRKNKEKMIAELKEKLKLEEKQAQEIYNTSMNLIASFVKDSLKHPFRSKDER